MGRQITGGQTIHGAPLLPTHARVYRPEKQPMAQPVNEAREEAEDDDHLSILTSRLNKLRKGLAKLLWELRTFGLECHVPLYINFDDAFEIIDGEKMLNIACIQLWSMYMDTIVVESGRPSVYGFLEPQTIQPSGNTLDSRKSYIQTWMTESNREIYIAPYIDAYVFPNIVNFYQILINKLTRTWKVKAELKSLIQTVVTRTRGQRLEIIYPKNDSWACGYYIMSWMKVIRAEIKGEWTERFNTTSSLSNVVTKTIRED
ncbi:hypothetical protein LR48_Vigan02g059300 [Vigna angularis]|uniref:Ubiquitin-like protease family profile domain-containing protein n=1 Tax=Phaseolus angularis TaxID=3914 RepID=A0A0L9TV56_PHAAN|nr:hypothetical protein LR48_Vigan02g059300 [Vigna angularis]